MAKFYSSYTALAISVIVAMVCFGIVVIALCLIGLIKKCKTCGRSGTYYVRDATRIYDVDTGRYDCIPLEEYTPPIFEPRPPRQGVKVMFTDEHGNLPPYTLRSRSVDGAVEKYTTYFTYHVGRETEV
jgi:hypothetical protein